MITNIATLFLWKKDETFIQDDATGIKIYSNKNVAAINGKKISYEDWLHSMQNKYGKNHLKLMIDHEIVRQLAEEKGIRIPDKIIDRELSLLVTTQGLMSDDELEDQKQRWQADIVYRYQLEALLTEDIQIAEEEVRTFYDNYSNQYHFSPMIQLSHIVVESEAIANKVMNELKEGALFHLLAEEYSLDDETKANGGYLGFYSENADHLPTIYYDTVSDMEPDSFSHPVQINDGVAIIYFHQYLPEITFTYDELKYFIKNELALKQLGFDHTADVFWEDFDIEWVYDNNQD